MNRSIVCVSNEMNVFCCTWGNLSLSLDLVCIASYECILQTFLCRYDGDDDDDGMTFEDQLAMFDEETDLQEGDTQESAGMSQHIIPSVTLSYGNRRN